LWRPCGCACVLSFDCPVITIRTCCPHLPQCTRLRSLKLPQARFLHSSDVTDSGHIRLSLLFPDPHESVSLWMDTSAPARAAPPDPPQYPPTDRLRSDFKCSPRQRQQNPLKSPAFSWKPIGTPRRTRRRPKCPDNAMEMVVFREGFRHRPPPIALEVHAHDSDNSQSLR
jgi:hypothetical protein